MLRFPLLTVATTLCTLACVVACSGAKSSDLFANGSDEPGLSGDATPTDAGAAAPAPSTSGTTPPGAPGQPPPKPDGTSDGGTGTECLAESEPNDTLDTGDPFTSTYCGKISTQADVDVAKITAPASATSMTLHHSESSPVDYRIYQNGALYAPALDSTGTYPVIGGSVYAFRMALPQQGSGSNRPTYQLAVSFP